MKINGIFKTVSEQAYADLADELRTVFVNGNLVNPITFEQVWVNAN